MSVRNHHYSHFTDSKQKLKIPETDHFDLASVDLKLNHLSLNTKDRYYYDLKDSI